MKLLFAGTPEAAVPSLRALHAAGHEIAMVITRPDAPLGRKRVLTASPVAAEAERLGLSVLKTGRLDAAATEQLIALGAALGVVVAYGGLVREPLLSTPEHGWINLHFSLLPRWRGAAPVQRAIAAGEATTGAAVFRLVPELDAGDVFAVRERPIAATDTSGSLLSALADEGAELLASVVAGIADGSARAVPQDGEVTLAPKLTLEDARIDWNSPTASVDAGIRAMTPEPGAFTIIDGGRFKVLEAAPAGGHGLPPGDISSIDGRVLAATADGSIELLRVQPAGKTAMNAADWWRGQTRERVSAQ